MGKRGDLAKVQINAAAVASARGSPARVMVLFYARFFNLIHSVRKT